MKKIQFVLVAAIALFITSCNDIDNRVIEMVGVYDANVVGLTDYFGMTISADGNDDLLIEAPFDGDVWSVVEVDVDDKDDFIKDIDIHRQSLGAGVEIWGDGFYSDGTIQLDYTIRFGSEKYDFRIIGEK